MKLSEFMVNEFINNKNHDKELCLIRIKETDFNEDDLLECNRYDNETAKAIAEVVDSELLNMEVEEITDEDNVLEVWIR